MDQWKNCVNCAVRSVDQGNGLESGSVQERGLIPSEVSRPASKPKDLKLLCENLILTFSARLLSLWFCWLAERHLMMSVPFLDIFQYSFIFKVQFWHSFPKISPTLYLPVPFHIQSPILTQLPQNFLHSIPTTTFLYSKYI